MKAMALKIKLLLNNGDWYPYYVLDLFDYNLLLTPYSLICPPKTSGNSKFSGAFGRYGRAALVSNG